jgi:hypothetical protein
MKETPKKRGVGRPKNESPSGTCSIWAPFSEHENIRDLAKKYLAGLPDKAGGK